MDCAKVASLPAMFFEQAARMGHAPFLWARTAGVWRSLDWAETAARVTLLARGLLAAGLQQGGRVVLVSENRPEWLIADLAIMAAGGVTVPGYVTNTVADHLHLLNDSGATHAIVSTPALAERVTGAAERTVRAMTIVTLYEPGHEPGPALSPRLRFHSWDAMLELGHSQPDDIARRVAALTRRDLACVIYTSGTGGVPRGVMQSHGAILHNCRGAALLLAELGLENEIFLSFLPLSHAYEHTAGQFFPMSIEAQIYYVESPDQMIGLLPDIRPTVMTAVPRLYEVMRARILQGMARQGGFRARLFDRAVALGSKRYENPTSLTLLERLEDKVLDRLVRRKIGQRFGGRFKAFVSGGAPLNYEVGLFFTALGVRLLQGYGQTESGPVLSCNKPSLSKLRTVGPPLADTEIRIAEDGEILARGEMVMLGYWNDPAATAQTVRDGWLHTGDVGHIGADGFLVITDRKKDIIVNSGGDNIAPQRVEGILVLRPEIGQAMVHGDRRPYLVALLVPSADFAADWARKHGVAAALDGLVANPDFRKAMSEAIDQVNRGLSAIERIRRFALIAEPFTVENGMGTPTLKLRRHVIRERYGDAIESLYKGPGV